MDSIWERSSIGMGGRLALYSGYRSSRNVLPFASKTTAASSGCTSASSRFSMFVMPYAAPVGCPLELVSDGIAWNARYRYEEPSTRTKRRRVADMGRWPAGGGAPGSAEGVSIAPGRSRSRLDDLGARRLVAAVHTSNARNSEPRRDRAPTSRRTGAAAERVGRSIDPPPSLKGPDPVERGHLYPA